MIILRLCTVYTQLSKPTHNLCAMTTKVLVVIIIIVKFHWFPINDKTCCELTTTCSKPKLPLHSAHNKPPFLLANILIYVVRPPRAILLQAVHTITHLV